MFPHLSPLSHRYKRTVETAAKTPAAEQHSPQPTPHRALRPPSMSPQFSNRLAPSASPLSFREFSHKYSPVRAAEQNPYSDSSLGSHKRRSASIENSLRHFQHRRLKTLQAIDERERKKKLAGLLSKRCGLKLSRVDQSRLSLDEMTRQAAEHRSRMLAQNAAKRLLQWLHHTVVRKGLMQIQARTHVAAFLIQQCWKQYRVTSTQRRVLQPRKALAARHCAATVIQKWTRGHLARLRYKKLKLMREVHCLHFHFQRVRFRSLMEKAPIILKSWREHRRRKVAASLVLDEPKPDVFKTSVKSPPMRQMTDRPQKLPSLKKSRVAADLTSDSDTPSSGAITTRKRATTDPMAAQQSVAERRKSIRFSTDESKPVKLLEKSKSLSGLSPTKQRRKRRKSKALARIDEIS